MCIQYTVYGIVYHESLLPISKTRPNQRNRIGVALPLLFVGHYWILNCGNWESIGEQDGETMGSTPYEQKQIDCHLEVSYYDPIWKVCLVILIINIRGKHRKPVFGNSLYIGFQTEFHQIWKQVFSTIIQVFV